MNILHNNSHNVIDSDVQKILPPNTIIWRYMAFSKYVDLLRTGSLYCRRADSFYDKTEGEWLVHVQTLSWSEWREIISNELKIHRRLIRELETNALLPQYVYGCLDKIKESDEYKNVPYETTEMLDALKDDFQSRYHEVISDFIESLKNYLQQWSANYEEIKDGWIELIEEVKRIKESSFLNCWHIAEYQHMAMWKIYGQYDECVAIKTTYENLQRVISKNDDILKQYGITYGFKQINYIGKVQKYHPKSQRASYSFHEKCVDALSLKHEIYSYEKELRLILTMDDLKKNKFVHNKGYYIKIGEILDLIDEVHVNPILSEDHLLLNLIRHVNKLHCLEKLKIVHEPLKTNLNLFKARYENRKEVLENGN